MELSSQEYEDAIMHDFRSNVINGQFGVCELGSCQYSIINNMINFINRWKGHYESVWTVFKLLDIDVKFNGIRKIEDVKMDFVDYQVIKDNNNRPDEIIWECEKMIMACKSESFDDLFRMCKKSAWDLWTAAETLSKMTFNDLEIICNHNPKTMGPQMNQEAQSDGIINAIQCYLFLENSLIKDIECLKDFDT